MIRQVGDASSYDPASALHDRSLRERPLMETAALRSADAMRRGHGLRRRPAAPQSRDIGCGGGAATRVSSMAPSLPDRLGAGERS